MARKTEQLQIRVSPEQKRALRRLARRAGTDMSSWILDRVLPAEATRFQSMIAKLVDHEGKASALAELADFLRDLPAGGFARATAEAPQAALDAGTLNHLAATVDHAAVNRGLTPPAWTTESPVPVEPVFGSALSSVRLHLLTTAPVAFRRRNIFVDSSIDERV